MIAPVFQEYVRPVTRKDLNTAGRGMRPFLNLDGSAGSPTSRKMARGKIRYLDSLPMIAVAAALSPVEIMAEPHLVSGNQHIVVGITLDEDVVRSSLPPGLEPAEGMTGGINLLNSAGGDAVDPYQRSYIWVDLAEATSVTGAPGRYMLWLADNVSSEELKRTWGYTAEAGTTVLEISDDQAKATTTVSDAPTLTVTVDLGSDDCTAGTGSVNYTGVPADGDGAMIIAQYSYSADFCPASPASVEIKAPEGHVLNGLEPTGLTWAVLARDLTMAASPNFPYEH